MKIFTWSRIQLVLFLFCRCGAPQAPIVEEKQTEELRSSILFSSSRNFTGLSPNRDNGKIIFKKNCAACHRLDDKSIVGPGMRRVAERIPHADKISWLANYVLNTADTLFARDAYIKKLKSKYPSPMPPFKNVLNKQELCDVVNYLLDSGRTYE